MVSTMAKGGLLVLGVALSHLAPLVSCTLYAADADMDYDYYMEDDQWSSRMVKLTDPKKVQEWIDEKFPDGEWMGRIVKGGSTSLHAYNGKLVFCFSEDGIKKIMSKVIMNKDVTAGRNFADVLGYDTPPPEPQTLVIFKTQRLPKENPQKLQIDWVTLAVWLEDLYKEEKFLKGSITIAEKYKAVVEQFAIDGPKAEFKNDLNTECEKDLQTKCSGTKEHEELLKMIKNQVACTQAWSNVLGFAPVEWLTGNRLIGTGGCVPSGKRWELRTLMAQSGFNPYWSGTGFTESSNKVQGVKEYLEPNSEIDKLEGIQYEIPPFQGSGRVAELRAKYEALRK